MKALELPVSRLKSERGLTLLETLIAAFILLFVLLSMISSYSLGRRDIDQEEVKRKATALGQDRLEMVKSRYANEVAGQDRRAAWDHIVAAQIDTTYSVDGRSFTLTSQVTPNGTQTSKTITVEVSWTAKRNNNTDVTRKIRMTTDVSRMAQAN